MPKPIVAIVPYEKPGHSVRQAIRQSQGLGGVDARIQSVHQTEHRILVGYRGRFLNGGVITTSRVVEDMVVALKGIMVSTILLSGKAWWPTSGILRPRPMRLNISGNVRWICRPSNSPECRSTRSATPMPTGMNTLRTPMGPGCRSRLWPRASEAFPIPNTTPPCVRIAQGSTG